MFHCIKWQHIFDSNTVSASNYSTMKQLFMVFHRKHNTHMLCEMEKFTNMWPRRPQQDFIMPPNIRLHRHPHCPNSCKIFCPSSLFTCRNCTVCQTTFMMLYAGHFITITPATIWSPIYLNLWLCLVRDSGLFIFLTQILIWSYSVAVPSQLSLAWIQDKELHARACTHAHTKFLSNILTVFYSSSAVQPAWPFCAGSCPTNDKSHPFWQ